MTIITTTYLYEKENHTDIINDYQINDHVIKY